MVIRLSFPIYLDNDALLCALELAAAIIMVYSVNLIEN